ncbi:MAG: AAA family ATPase [Deltaproteobacteria bacterium]|nr:AAA family ATPase [Deltaproteobacteria bacterium]MBW2105504.1 AAA family ATPase [Deltaproteobacteria bacterium]
MKEIIQSHFQGNYQAFYEKYLPDIKKIGGDEFKARCPFDGHEDINASFNFSNQTGQYFCHGCGKKGDAIHFYAKINSLDTKRDFGKILKGIASDFGIPYEEQKAHIEKTYDYTDAEGNLLFQVVRMNPKDFRQRRPGNNGNWIWDLKGVERILYRLSQVVNAQEVLIVEGEKDADTLADLGLIATTCPMGAKKWRPEYNEYLKGKDVVLIPDNDNEGREHMTQVGASLHGLVRSLKLIELPDLPSKGDVSDFIAKFDDKEDAKEKLSIMIDGAGPYKPPKIATIEDVILQAKDFSTLELPPKKCLLNPWLTEQSITLISGWRGTGKTWLALSILDAVTKGQAFGPWEAEESVPCLFLDGEMPAQDISERIEALNLDRVYIYSDFYSNTLGLPRANLLSETWRTSMKRILTTRGVKLWVVDNIASLASGIDENTKKDWDPINQWLLELRFAGIATIMLHHTNKDGGQRGTSAREDNLDNSIILKRPFDYTPEDGCKFIVHFTKARVRTQDLGLITDTQFQLREDETGRLTWIWGGIKAEAKKEILRLTDEGMQGSDIASLVGVSRPYVSKIQKVARNDGYLTSKGKLSQSGFSFINED